MPKKCKKKSKKNTLLPSNNLTLNDYANSSVESCKTRVKKGQISNAITKVTVADERDWFEKSLEEFQIGSDTEELDPKSDGKYKSRNRRKRNSSLTDLSKEDKGNSYPVDIWFILSRYIRPEDVGRFGGICTSAHFVTKTPQFWVRLYKRYYSPLEKLPLSLQPESIEKMHGLRTAVIRSLFHLYQPFKLRSKLSGDPHSLVKRVISSFWHQRGREVYHYYFKLKEQDDGESAIEYKVLRKMKQPDIIEMLGDISANTDARYKVLLVSTRDFVSIPPSILSQSLLSFTQDLSSDLRTFTLRLVFGPPHSYHQMRAGKRAFQSIPEGAVGVILNSVTMVRILDWFNPNYPFPSYEKILDPSTTAPQDSFFDSDF